MLNSMLEFFSDFPEILISPFPLVIGSMPCNKWRHGGENRKKIALFSGKINEMYVIIQEQVSCWLGSKSSVVNKENRAKTLNC